MDRVWQHASTPALRVVAGVQGLEVFPNEVAPDDPRTPDQIAEATSHPDDHEALELAVGRHVRDGTPYRFEFRVRLPDGCWRWLLTRGRALRDAHDRVVGMAGINYDITERKEAEALRLNACADPLGGTEFVFERPAAPAGPISVLGVEDNPVNLLLVRELLSMRPQIRCTRPSTAPAVSRPALAHSTFVALSANAMPEQIAAARAAGFDDYWTKPIDFAHFLSGLDRIHQGARRSRSQVPSATR